MTHISTYCCTVTMQSRRNSGLSLSFSTSSATRTFDPIVFYLLWKFLITQNNYFYCFIFSSYFRLRLYSFTLRELYHPFQKTSLFSISINPIKVCLHGHWRCDGSVALASFNLASTANKSSEDVVVWAAVQPSNTSTYAGTLMCLYSPRCCSFTAIFSHAS